MLKENLRGTDQTHFVYPSGVDRFKEQFAHLEECNGRIERSSPLHRKHAISLPRERICSTDESDIIIKRAAKSATSAVASN